MSEMQQAVGEVLAATSGAAPEVQAAAAAAAVTGTIPTPAQPTVGFLWKALIVGLLLILVLALVGVVYAVMDGDDKTSPDVLVTIFASVLTGLIGFFAPSPAKG